MPEGDTVYLAAKRLDALLAGRRIDRSDVRLPSLATIDFAGIDCLGVRPVGKHLLFRFSNDTSLHTHFRMDGSWHIYRTGQRWKGGPMHAVRLVLYSGDAVAVGYRLHDVLVRAEFGQFPGQGQTKSGALVAPVEVAVHLGKGLEHLVDVVHRNADAGVRDFQDETVLWVEIGSYLDGAAGRRELEGVRDHVHDDLF